MLTVLSSQDLASWRKDHFCPYDLGWLMRLAGSDPVRFLVMCKPLVNRIGTCAFSTTWLQYGLSALLKTVRETHDGDLLPELVARRQFSALSAAQARTLLLLAEKKLGSRAEAHDLVACLVHLGPDPLLQIVQCL